MSQAVEDDDSGSPLPDNVVGMTPTTTATMAGAEIECLVDTASMVTLVSETFYTQKSKCGRVRSCGKMLALKGANGLEIPYLGYLELDVVVGGVTIPKCGVLVLKDTAATVERRSRLPGLLGTNVLAKIPRWAELMTSKEKTGTLVHEVETQIPVKRRMVRFAGKSAVLVPPYSVMDVMVRGRITGETAMVEPPSTPLQGNLQVARTLVDTTRSSHVMQVINPTGKDIWLKPRTCLGTLQAVDEVRGEQLKFAVGSNEVVVSCSLDADCQQTSSQIAGSTAKPQNVQGCPDGLTLEGTES